MKSDKEKTGKTGFATPDEGRREALLFPAVGVVTISSLKAEVKVSLVSPPTIDSSFETVKDYYDNTLNLDKSTYTSSNDEPTPISCILRMIEEIPEEL